MHDEPELVMDDEDNNDSSSLTAPVSDDDDEQEFIAQDDRFSKPFQRLVDYLGGKVHEAKAVVREGLKARKAGASVITDVDPALDVHPDQGVTTAVQKDMGR